MNRDDGDSSQQHGDNHGCTMRAFRFVPQEARGSLLGSIHLGERYDAGDV